MYLYYSSVYKMKKRNKITQIEILYCICNNIQCTIQIYRKKRNFIFFLEIKYQFIQKYLKTSPNHSKF